jgi:adenylate cyclase
MAIGADVSDAVATLMAESWSITDGTVVPETDDVVLKNGGRKVDATYLYADLADSSGLARLWKKEATAKVIRAYINSSVRICRHYSGEIRSFDGDRVMAVFMGDRKNNNAVRAALGINWAVQKVIDPRIKSTWTNTEKTWTINHGVGIDTGEALIVRGGVRDHNDLVSIGRAPNLAAKLSEIRGRAEKIFITDGVYNRLLEENKVTGANKTSMWSNLGENDIGGGKVKVYASSYHWQPA